jgi:hypothetical protein
MNADAERRERAPVAGDGLSLRGVNGACSGLISAERVTMKRS